MKAVSERADRGLRGVLALLVWSALLLPVITARACGDGPDRVVHGWEVAVYGSEDPVSPAQAGSMMDAAIRRLSPFALILVCTAVLGARRRPAAEDPLRVQVWHGAGAFAALANALLFILYMAVAFLFDTIHLRSGYVAVLAGLGGLWLVHVAQARGAGAPGVGGAAWNTPDADRPFPGVGWAAWVLAALFALGVSVLLIGAAADSGLEAWPLLLPWGLWVFTALRVLPRHFRALRLRRPWAGRAALLLFSLSAGPWVLFWVMVTVADALR